MPAPRWPPRFAGSIGATGASKSTFSRNSSASVWMYLIVVSTLAWRANDLSDSHDGAAPGDTGVPRGVEIEVPCVGAVFDLGRGQILPEHLHRVV